MPERMSWCQTPAEVKLVTKPWGNTSVDGVEGVGELWLNYTRGEEVGEREKRYVFKLLYIREGTRTSFQYHVKKLETNHLVSGHAIAYMENDAGQLEESIFEAGDTWTVPCGRRHRLLALTDLVMLEASTPEVDDVVRIQDDAGRGDGRIQSEHG